MAQTTQKKRAAPKRSQGSQRSRSTDRGSTKAKARKRSSSTRSNGSRKATPQALEAVKAAEQKAEKRAKGAGRAVGSAASRAKVPLIAGGAALAGAAGGAALAATRKNRPRWAGVRKPLFKVSSDDMAKAAKEVGNFGAEVGRLAGELQRNREAANGHGHGRPRRSPVEVVLQGLTQRR